MKKDIIKILLLVGKILIIEDNFSIIETGREVYILFSDTKNKEYEQLEKLINDLVPKVDLMSLINENCEDDDEKSYDLMKSKEAAPIAKIFEDNDFQKIFFKDNTDCRLFENYHCLLASNIAESLKQYFNCRESIHFENSTIRSCTKDQKAQDKKNNKYEFYLAGNIYYKNIPEQDIFPIIEKVKKLKN